MIVQVLKFRLYFWLVALTIFAACLAQSAFAKKQIALTFDDVPRTQGAFFEPDERTMRIISALKDGKVRQAAFFVNPGFLEAPHGKGGEERIASYVAAGHVIANHSFAHIPLSVTAADIYLKGIDKTDVWLKKLPGYRPWYRYPNLDEGREDRIKRDTVRKGLAERSLLNAQVTADGSDWFLESLTVGAKSAGKPMDMESLRRLYVTVHMSGVEYADARARQILGRSPRHVLLLHETDIAALFLPDLIADLKRAGWTIITADAAFADPLYKATTDSPDARGTILKMIGDARKLPEPAWPLWIDPLLMKSLFDRQVLKQSINTQGIP